MVYARCDWQRWPRKDGPDEMRAEYVFDYATAVRGKYYRRLLKEGANVVVLDPDVASVFPDAESVNRSLRALADIIRRQGKTAPRG